MNVAREIADAIGTDSFGVSNRDETYRKIKEAIQAAKLEAYQEASKHLEKRGEALYVDYDDKVGDYLCRDLAEEIRKLGMLDKHSGSE